MSSPAPVEMDPVRRLEGHLKIEVNVDLVNGRQQVVDAKVAGTTTCGFETILKSRDPLDAPDLAQRMYGVSPICHGLAASAALEAAAGVVVPENARIIRNLALGANFLQAHITHFYHLAAQDFVDGPAMPPWQPSWLADRRLTPGESQAFVRHYVKALEMRRKAQEMGALFGGRLPESPAVVPGGVTIVPRATRIVKFKRLLTQLIPFIEQVYIPDAAVLAHRYPDYFSIGGGSCAMLAYGAFDLDAIGRNQLFRRGLIEADGARKPLDVDAVGGHVTGSWLKAPRYEGAACEAGPLARMCVNGDYPLRVSVMNRHEARAQEARRVARAMQSWIVELEARGAVYQRYETPANASGMGLTEAPHGALSHWVEIRGKRISDYQVVTPTCWNASPRDGAGIRGPLEQALIGTPVADPKQPLEVLRVIHSFDPWFSCAVQAELPIEDRQSIAAPRFPSGANEEPRQRNQACMG